MQPQSHKPSTIELQLQQTNRAINRLKEGQKCLTDIKQRAEYMVLLYSKGVYSQNSSKIKELRQEIDPRPSLAELEKIILESAYPTIHNLKQRASHDQYISLRDKQQLQMSTLKYCEEISTICQTAENLKEYKHYNDCFKQPKSLMITIAYQTIMNQIQFLAQKDDLLIVKFDRATHFEDLPDPFYITLVRQDLLCITLQFRKLVGTEEDRQKEKVAIFDITYSGLFDGDEDMNKEERQIIIEKRCMTDDTKALIQLIKRNHKRVSLPCLKSRHHCFQRLSYFICDRLEQIFLSNITDALRARQGGQLDDEGKIQYIIQKSPQEAYQSFGQQCSICGQRIAVDNEYQKLFPCMALRSGKNEKYPIHIGCKKTIEHKGDRLPAVCVEINPPTIDSAQDMYQI